MIRVRTMCISDCCCFHCIYCHCNLTCVSYFHSSSLLSYDRWRCANDHWASKIVKTIAVDPWWLSIQFYFVCPLYQLQSHLCFFVFKKMSIYLQFSTIIKELNVLYRHHHIAGASSIKILEVTSDKPKILSLQDPEDLQLFIQRYLFELYCIIYNISTVNGCQFSSLLVILSLCVRTSNKFA